MLAAALATAAVASTAETLRCTAGTVTAVADDPALAQRICRHSETALAAFAACDFPALAAVTITAVTKTERGCLGLYHCGIDRIDVLTPEAMQAMRASDSIFREVPIGPFFASVIRHELSHALYDRTPCPYGDCLATSEYFAYTQQIAGLPEAHRHRIEARQTPDEPGNRASVSAIMLMMNPNRFALNAWTHLSARGDACAYSRQILDGTVLFDRPHP
ncbi:hypothetical protein [Roseovarius ramblicola]|uniref:Uncharacterized protein n=1 Tax=Roseovarius ramblicola TaxID=2022336 RepID=A0ABV5I164_9RHOB